MVAVALFNADEEPEVGWSVPQGSEIIEQVWTFCLHEQHDLIIEWLQT